MGRHPTRQAAGVTSERPLLVRTARRLAVFTVAYNLGEGLVAIVAALVAGSGALLGFGVDSGIESVSAAVLLWRLAAERHRAERAARAEHVAARAIGISFVVLAAYISYDAISALATREEPDGSIVGIALTASSLIVMPVLARRKHRIAVALGSKAAEADSNQTWACAWLSAIVLVGLVLNATLDWWWADPIAALGVAVFLLREGREALSSDELDDCC